MSQFARQLRTPEERVGMLSNASLPPPHVRDEEEVLLGRALEQRDEAAFAHVLDLYYPPMLRLALAHVRTRAAADEAIQDTWLAALKGFGGFEGRSSIKTWLFRILRNVARATGRREGRSSSFSDLFVEDGTGSAEDLPRGTTTDSGSAPTALWTQSSDPERELLSAELAQQLEAAIATLPSRQREVLVLRDVEGWSAAEVCNALGLSDTNQRVILHRARDRVRGELRGYLEDSDGCHDDRDAGMF